MIVIGSGLSGLTVAKVLATAGRKVLVLEQHDRAGGSCHTFTLDKYEFDVGQFCYSSKFGCIRITLFLPFIADPV